MSIWQDHRESTCKGSSGVQWVQAGTQMEVGRGREELFSSLPLIPLSLVPSDVPRVFPQRPEKLRHCPTQIRHSQLRGQVTCVPKRVWGMC